MAELQRIEDLQELVGYDAPDWVKADRNETQGHVHTSNLDEAMAVHMDTSGELRELAENTYGGDDDRDMYGVLMDAAERLDDAHQEWLERKLKDQEKRETGAASIVISLSDGVIEITHGDCGTVLARNANAQKGDWNKMWTVLTEVLGITRIEGDGS